MHFYFTLIIFISFEKMKELMDCIGNNSYLHIVVVPEISLGYRSMAPSNFSSWHLRSIGGLLGGAHHFSKQHVKSCCRLLGTSNKSHSHDLTLHECTVI